MICDPIYLLLKFKRIVKARIQIAVSKRKAEVEQGRGYRKELTLGGTRRYPPLGKILRGLPRDPAKLYHGILRGSAVVLVSVLFLSFGTGQSVPADSSEQAGPPVLRPTLLADSLPPPKITAKSAYLLDLKSGFVLYDKNSQLRVPPASTTKIATALVAFDDYRLEEVVAVHPDCAFRSGESLMGLFPNERISVRNLLRGVLIASASDAACALARHHREGMLEFIGEMNALADSLDLERTYFVNPSGMDSTHQYSTARELALLAEEALGKRFLRETVKIREMNISSIDGKRWHKLKNTNELLGKMKGVLGVKTGYTAKAKEVFVFYLKRGEQELLGTVMGSNDRFGDAGLLLNWALSSFLFP